MILWFLDIYTSLFHFCEHRLTREANLRSTRTISLSAISDRKHDDRLLCRWKTKYSIECTRVKSLHRTRVDLELCTRSKGESMRDICLLCRPGEDIFWVSLPLYEASYHIFISLEHSSNTRIATREESEVLFFQYWKICSRCEDYKMRRCTDLWLIPCCCLDFLFHLLIRHDIEMIWLHPKRCGSHTDGFDDTIEVSIRYFSTRVELLRRISPREIGKERHIKRS